MLIGYFENQIRSEIIEILKKHKVDDKILIRNRLGYAGKGKNGEIEVVAINREMRISETLAIDLLNLKLKNVRLI